MQDDYQGKRVLVAGFGIEGASSAAFFADRGAQVTVQDRKAEKDLHASMIAQLRAKGVMFQLERDVPEGSFDIAVRSPGIGLYKPVITFLSNQGAVITSTTKLFFDLCPCPIIGVTGTKGKGTTSSLIAEMLKQEGRKVELVGNIGTPVLDCLDHLTPEHWVVFEMSSFQLMDLKKSPHIAVVLMTTVEHLDVHKDEAEYVEAKAQIAAHQTVDDVMVFNGDYANSRKIAERSVGMAYEVSRFHEVERGCFVRGTELVWRDGQIEEVIATVDDVRLPGAHNLENVCAAISAAKAAGVSSRAMIRALRSFTGLEHRIEFVREINGVRYYNDSFGTTPETAIAAIEAFDAPEVLILGGSSKGSDFTALAQTIVKRPPIRAIIGIGVEWLHIKEALVAAGGEAIPVIENCQNMTEIVAEASRVAQPGDVVLLSPACASFGMFKNYKERGKLFKEAIISLDAKA
ncbi:MAG: UDP-N-acetylmuramoyl-L-alanine--D-glutamate ligase [Patescibacteria group bacterium]